MHILYSRIVTELRQKSETVILKIVNFQTEYKLNLCNLSFIQIC